MGFTGHVSPVRIVISFWFFLSPAGGSWWENAIAAFLNRNYPVSWLVRDVSAPSYLVGLRGDVICIYTRCSH